jgi:hypothetical protein
MTSGETPRQVRMTIADLSAAFISLVFAGWAFYESGRWPAPEFIPRAVAGILVFVAGLLAWNALRGRSNVIEKPVDAAKFRRIASILGLTAVYSLALEPAGFIPATVIYLIVFLRFMGATKWLSIVGFSILLTGGFHAIFDLALKVPLPPVEWLN